MFYTGGRMLKRKIATAILLSVTAGALFAQDPANGDTWHGIVPLDLLRPRRQEAPRYPVDIVIGPLGQGRASREAYLFARGIAGALVSGNIDAPALSTMDRVFLDDYMAALDMVFPRSFRLGGGHENPDGSISFLVRFIGRDQGITGELFVRHENRRVAPPPPPADWEAPLAEALGETVDEATGEALVEALAADEPEVAPEPPPPVFELVWVFEDLILESPRSREEENLESRQRFGFSVYHRLF